MRSGIDCKGRKWEEIKLGQAKDLSQETFYYLKPQFRVKTDIKETAWLCNCQCGNEVVISAHSLTGNRTKSCGCYSTEIKKSRYKDLTGQQFFYLTVLEHIGTKNESALWKCQCKCGNIVEVTANKLTSGWTKSCGCYAREKSSERMWKHNLIGQKINHLLVLERDYTQGYSPIRYKCQCDCGNIIVTTQTMLLTNGRISCGCSHLSKGEERIINILNANHINYSFDSRFFKDLIMCKGGIGRYDFIIFNDKQEPIRLIEYDGEQHFFSNGYGENNRFQGDLETTQLNDIIKNNYALNHNLPLVRIPYYAFDEITLDILLYQDKFLVKRYNMGEVAD